MRKIRDDVDLYWRTDTHWTPEGSLLAYERLCDALNLAPNAELATRPAQALNKIMDLGSKFDPPLWESVREIDWIAGAQRVYVNGIARILETPLHGGDIHVGAHVIFRNEDAPNNKKILLFGDLFASVGHDRLTAQLAETARELAFVWSANVDWGLVERLKPGILVTETPSVIWRWRPMTASVFDSRSSRSLSRRAGGKRPSGGAGHGRNAVSASRTAHRLRSPCANRSGRAPSRPKPRHGG